MKKNNAFSFLVVLLLSGFSYCLSGQSLSGHKTLAIDAAAPAFNLPGVDGKTYTLESFKNSKILVIPQLSNIL